MAQRFVNLEEAAKELGVSKDRLNELREDGKVRAYRDGAGWKFRAEDIEKLVAEGIPGGDPGASDISLDLDVEEPSTPEPTSDLEIELDDDEFVAGAGASDVSLEDLDEPTVPVDAASDSDALILDDASSIDDLSESILLSEAELGESTDRPPSTIIGKAEMAAELDLEMASASDPAMSDVKLAPSMSNVFNVSRDDVFDNEPPSLTDNFGDLAELEVDLEAESSRILSPEDVSMAKQAATEARAAAMSDLELAPTDSNAPGGGKNALDSIIGGGSDFAGLSALELEGDDDDEVLGEGSDITLSSESSGINIISPSDSGLALDELSASASMGSPLDLGVSDSDVPLEALEVDEVVAPAKGEEPFTLTPFGEEAAEEDEDSSQIIPLDEVSEEEGGPLHGVGVGHADVIGDDFATAGIGAAPIGEPVVETPFSTANVVGLVLCVIPLALVGMMMFDLLRNIWSWDEVYTLNSTLLEIVNPFIG